MTDRDARLATARNCWFATARADGRPHLTPIWFVHLDGAFYICTGRASVKVRNVLANPAVAVSLEDGNDPIVAEGDAVVVDRPYPHEVVQAFATKFAWDITTSPDPDVGEVALVRVDVRRWLMGGS